MERMTGVSFWVYGKGISKTASKEEGRRWWGPVSWVLHPLCLLRNLTTTLGCTSHWVKSGQTLRTHTPSCWRGHRGVRVCEWVKSAFTFKQGRALRVVTLLLQCYKRSSCNGGGKLLWVCWLILGGHTRYSEYVGTPSNSVSLLCLYLWLVTVHLKGSLERHCFHKDLAGFPIQLSTILKGSWSQLFPLTSTKKKANNPVFIRNPPFKFLLMTHTFAIDSFQHCLFPLQQRIQQDTEITS